MHIQIEKDTCNCVFFYVNTLAYNAPQLYYLHRDYLGSITQISDNSGNLAAEYSYDAWGRMRNPDTWQLYAPDAQPALLFGRGYTGHSLSRFLSGNT